MKFLSLALVVLALTGSARDARAQSDDLRAALCRGRPACEIVARTPASRDTATQPVEVVEIGLGRDNSEGGLACRPQRREFWVVIGGTPRDLILDLCNDGYGAAGVGEDEVRIFRNRLVHHQLGGSAWRWSVLTRYRVAPAMRLREERCFFHTLSTGFQIVEWNWLEFTGLVLMRYQDAGEPEDGMTIGCESQNATHRYLPVPRIGAVDDLPEDAAPALGSCAVKVREDGASGFLVHGPPAKHDGAEMRLLLVGERDLLVTVIDPEIASDGDSWIHDDHVEIWQAGLLSSDPDFLESEPFQQWGVRLSDGAVFSGAGEPEEQPQVLARRETEIDGVTAVTMRLRLVRQASSLTVVYSNSREGRQYRLTATSPFRFGEARSLGALFNVGDGARCGVRDGTVLLRRSGILNAQDQE